MHDFAREASQEVPSASRKSISGPVLVAGD
jgi:hypothetical protein